MTSYGRAKELLKASLELAECAVKVTSQPYALPLRFYLGGDIAEP